MARPKTEFRNEMKTRVSDRVFEGVQQFMSANRCASEARAISELLELALFGTIGSVPPTLTDNSHATVQSGPEMIRHR